MSEEEERKKKIAEIAEEVEKLKELQKTKGIEIQMDLDVFSKARPDTSLQDLSGIAEKSREYLQQIGKQAYSEEMKTEEAIDETLKMLSNVEANAKWKEPYLEVNLLLEWATYRAFCGMGAEVPPGYGPLLNTDGTEPIFTAPGDKPDLIAEFDSIVLVVEETISSGSRQYESEGEPVTRHVAQAVKDYREREDARPVMGVFIARELNNNVLDYFLVHFSRHKHWICDDFLFIIPMEVSDFRGILKASAEGHLQIPEAIAELYSELNQWRDEGICSECETCCILYEQWVSEIDELVDGLKTGQ
ncbi:MAG: AlwI family type II restriction endonuclease [Methanomassiliicoccales archaeon]|nr:MAG: AlwI family type II restriction endonuclease [Methanomassiliicoccales archaeon]